MLNTAIATNQPIASVNFIAEKKRYKSDPFMISGGRYVGHDGFVVPRDFDEFQERFPRHIPNWIRKHAERFASEEDLADWTQDLTIHLKYLPATSKHRESGKEDIVQTFDPSKHYGANQSRFLNYINLCLANKFRTMRSKCMKDALCHPGNMTLAVRMDAEKPGQIDDEFCHAHSQYLRRIAEISEKRARDGAFVMEFIDFVRRKDPSVLTAIEAILATGTMGDAADFLGIMDARFSRLRTRIRQLGKCFMTGDDHVPKQRKPYKKRRKTVASLVAA